MHGGRSFIATTVVLAGMLAGCGNPFVTVDTRLSGDVAAWRKLDGPRYAVVGDDPKLQASLVFEDCARLWQQVLARVRPELQRVSGSEQADLVFTVGFGITDLGTGMTTRPIYGWAHGYAVGRGGRVMDSYHSYDVIGTEIDTYHRGFSHAMGISAWVPDASQPAGRRVIWEGQAERTTDEADLKEAMPYLAYAFGQFYGQATSKPTRIKVEKEDLPSLGPVLVPPATAAAP